MKLQAVLTVAGSDSSGGAGIQADLKTIAAHGLFGETVITALTAQNTCGVTGIMEVDPAFVELQFDAVFEDIPPAAVKIGMLSDSPVASAVAKSLAKHGAGSIVVDPVMVATSGADLMRGGAVKTLVEEVMPLASIVTPNLSEAAVLAGFDVMQGGIEAMVEAARRIAALTPGAVLVKGGHLAGDLCATDVLLTGIEADPIVLRGTHIEAVGTHGTGCTLSSAIACGLARGLDVEDAVVRAKAYLTRCLAAGLDLGRGDGPLDHMAPHRPIAETLW